MYSGKQHRNNKNPLQKHEKIIDLILTNFDYAFNIKLSEKTKSFIQSNYHSFLAHYLIDFLICNFVIAPAIISVWRGVWDHSLIYLDNNDNTDNNHTSEHIIYLAEQIGKVKLLGILNLLSSKLLSIKY